MTSWGAANVAGPFQSKKTKMFPFVQEDRALLAHRRAAAGEKGRADVGSDMVPGRVKGTSSGGDGARGASN